MNGKCKPEIQSDFMDNFIMDMNCKNTYKRIGKHHLLVLVIGKRLHIGKRSNEQMTFRI
jgi:hypothetical protein